MSLNPNTINQCIQRVVEVKDLLSVISNPEIGGGPMVLDRGWSGGAKMCISRHRGVQLILAYSWARPAVLVVGGGAGVGKGRGGMFLFLLFLHFHSCSSLFPAPLFRLFCYLFSLSLGHNTK